MPKPEIKTRAKPRPAKTDAVTPWVSKDAFIRAVGIAAARGEAGTPHVLFVMHVERLNDIARGCGRVAESAALDLIALVLCNLTGEGFPFCRLEKDRIAVIKRHCAPSLVPALAGQIRTSIEGGVFNWHGRRFRLGVSVGAVVLLPDAEGPRRLIERAREASFAAQGPGIQGCLVLDGSDEEKSRREKDRAWFEHLSETIV